MLRSLFNGRRAVTNHRRAAPLRLETLGDRLVPASFSYDPANDIASIVGDSSADTITILNHGDGSFTASDESGTTVNFTNVDWLRVETHGGADVVRYKLDGALIQNSVITAHLGDGNDRFTGTLNRDIAADTFLTAVVSGGSGNDLLTMYGTPTAPARAGDFLTDGLAINTGGLRVGAGGSLDVLLDGESGNDRIHMDYQGELDGTLIFNGWGGGGDDTVSAIVRLQAGSTGRVGRGDYPALVRGDDGTDNLRFHVFDESGNSRPVFAEIDGGLDWWWPFETDRGSRTANVRHVGEVEDLDTI